MVASEPEVHRAAKGAIRLDQSADGRAFALKSDFLFLIESRPSQVDMHVRGRHLRVLAKLDDLKQKIISGQISMNRWARPNW